MTASKSIIIGRVRILDIPNAIRQARQLPGKLLGLFNGRSPGIFEGSGISLETDNVALEGCHLRLERADYVEATFDPLDVTFDAAEVGPWSVTHNFVVV